MKLTQKKHRKLNQFLPKMGTDELNLTRQNGTKWSKIINKIERKMAEIESIPAGNEPTSNSDNGDRTLTNKRTWITNKNQ